MNEADFAALREHLEEVRPVFDEFCARYGFSYTDPRSLGRYPRIRIERAGAVTLWFDLWMELDEHGRRIERFRRDLPYELSAGAYVDVQDGSKYGHRFQCAVPCFSGTPFEQVAGVLRGELERQLRALETWDEQYLRDHGERVQLGA